MTEAADFDRRFGGLRRLYGESGARSIFNAHVMVVGVGGVGSWTAEALARSGVGRLTLVDFDHISESNINRQVHALTDTLGRSKIDALAHRIAQINPDCEVDLVDDFLTPENGPGLLARLQAGAPQPVGLVDACDQAQAKTWMAAQAMAGSWIHVMVGAAGGKRKAHAVDVADLTAVTHDPLLAGVRQRLRKSHGLRRTGESGLACVFSREPVSRPTLNVDTCSTGLAPTAAVPGGAPINCAGYGSSVAVTAAFGFVAAGHVLERLAIWGESHC